MNDDFEDEPDHDYSDNEEESEDYEHDIEEEVEDTDDDVSLSEIIQPKIEKKTDLIRNRTRNLIIVPPNERITDNRLHKNEASYILSVRAKEIAKYGTNFIGEHSFTNSMAIAYEELYTHKCPLKLRRQVGISAKGDLIVEEWDTKLMVLPNIPKFK